MAVIAILGLLQMPLPREHLHLVPEYPSVSSTFDDTKIMKTRMYSYLPLQWSPLDVSTGEVCHTLLKTLPFLAVGNYVAVEV